MNDEHLEQLSAYLDGELSDAEAAAVEKLLASDEEAARALENLRAVSTRVRNAPRATAPAVFAAGVMDAIEKIEGPHADGDSNGIPSKDGTSDAAQVQIIERSRLLAGPGRPPWYKDPRAWGWPLAAAASVALVVQLGADSRTPTTTAASAHDRTAERRLDTSSAAADETQSEDSVRYALEPNEAMTEWGRSEARFEDLAENRDILAHSTSEVELDAMGDLDRDAWSFSDAQLAQQVHSIEESIGGYGGYGGAPGNGGMGGGGFGAAPNGDANTLGAAPYSGAERGGYGAPNFVPDLYPAENSANSNDAQTVGRESLAGEPLERQRYRTPELDAKNSDFGAAPASTLATAQPSLAAEDERRLAAVTGADDRSTAEYPLHRTEPAAQAEAVIESGVELYSATTAEEGELLSGTLLDKSAPDAAAADGATSEAAPDVKLDDVGRTELAAASAPVAASGPRDAPDRLEEQMTERQLSEDELFAQRGREAGQQVAGRANERFYYQAPADSAADATSLARHYATNQGVVYFDIESNSPAAPQFVEETLSNNGIVAFQQSPDAPPADGRITAETAPNAWFVVADPEQIVAAADELRGNAVDFQSVLVNYADLPPQQNALMAGAPLELNKARAPSEPAGDEGVAFAEESVGARGLTRSQVATANTAAEQAGAAVKLQNLAEPELRNILVERKKAVDAEAARRRVALQSRISRAAEAEEGVEAPPAAGKVLAILNLRYKAKQPAAAEEQQD